MLANLFQQVVVTEKLDGGNCCIHNGAVYARTHRQPASHPSFGPIKALAAQWQALRQDLDLSLSSCLGLSVAEQHTVCNYPLRKEEVSMLERLALFGENMTAVHSIAYDGLTSHFYLFAGEPAVAGCSASKGCFSILRFHQHGAVYSGHIQRLA